MNVSIHNLVKWAVYLFLIASLPGCKDNRKSQAVSESDILSTFKLAEGFQIELVAIEPLVADPVAMEIDEQGRMYVVEMHGYPLDKSGSGSVKLLSDTDGDGVMDKSVTFAEDLVLPNGIMRWKSGILVTDAPNVLYFEDTDGDGHADLRDTLVTGFALSNPQHKVNTPFYGIDNWIYLANEPITTAKVYTEEFGDEGSEIRYPDHPQAPVLPKNASGHRVRLRPDRKALEMLSAATQFSNAQDTWGRHFLGNNTNHIVHDVVQARYLERNPHLEATGSTQTMSTYGMPADVYPITDNPEHQIFTSVGVFTSACGVTLYGGGLFPEPFNNVAFIAEPVSNIVHAAKLEEDGSSFKASRLYEKQEFIASKDSWFRPVNHYIGPDGALYVLDYHRRYIEHPEWMGEDIIQSGALYEGKDQGRIYRITPTGTPPAKWTNGLNLGKAEDPELIRYLSHSNAWYRRTAQRLLVDRQNKSLAGELQKVILSDTAAYGRLHAAWTMEGLGVLNAEAIKTLLKDPVAGVRENGIVLAELFSGKAPDLTSALLPLKNDGNPRVRFQLLCSLGNDSSAQVSKAREQILFDDINNPWIQVAALSARRPDYPALLDHAIRQFGTDTDGPALFIRRLSSMYASQSGVGQAKALMKLALHTKDRHKGIWQSAVLAGLSQKKNAGDFKNKELEAEKLELLDAAIHNTYNPLREASLNLLKLTGLPQGDAARKAIDNAVKVAKNVNATSENRRQAITLLSINDPEVHQNLLYGLLAPSQPLEVQKASLKVLGASGGTGIAGYLRDHWQGISPQLRDMAIGIFLESKERILMLVESIEAGTIAPSSIGFYRQIFLMTLEDEAMRTRTRKLFVDESKDNDRKNIIAGYKAAIGSKGNFANGKLVFEKNCAVCHQIGGKGGTALAPDLGTIRNRRPESILADILDPGLSIADGFDLWQIELKNGETKQGIIASETHTTLALNLPGGQKEVINRQNISSLRALGITLMPTGLEGSISKTEMADLLTFIKEVNSEKQ